MPRRHPRNTMTDRTDRTSELETELEDTKCKLANSQALLQNVINDRNKKAKTGENGLEYKAQVNSAMKDTVFKICKFLTSPEQENQFMEQVVEAMDVASLKGNTDDAVCERGRFMVNYKKHCVSELNSLRGYAQAQMKAVAWEWLGSHGNTLPPLEKIVRCANRNLSPKNAANKDTIMFYVNLMMPKMTGNARDFSNKVRYYYTISEAKSNPNVSLVDITPETEAFGLLVLENNYEKWPELKKLEDALPKNNKKSQVVKTKKPEHDDNTTTNFFYEDKNPKLKTKYTDPSVGQKEYGGWTTEGIKRYVTFRQSIAYVRKTEGAKTWEAAVLDIIRNERGITELTYELQRKKEGKGASKSPKAAVEVVPNLFANDDDSDEEVDLIAMV